MQRLPTKDSASGNVFSVADFYEAGRTALSLELVTRGGRLARLIEEPIVNRPGLALSGFYVHFASRRLQLIGKAEKAYMLSLDPETRRARFQALLDRDAFCLYSYLEYE